MAFTQEEQDYITSNKEELKSRLLKDFKSKVIDINSKDRFDSDQKLAQINEINSSLSNDFKILEQPNIELDEPSLGLSDLIRRGTQFAYIRNTKEQGNESVQRELRDPSIIIPEREQNPDENESLLSDEEKGNIPSEITDISMSFLEVEKKSDELIESIRGFSEPQAETFNNSEDQSIYDDASDVSFEEEALEDPEEELDRQDKLKSSDDRKKHRKTIEELDKTIERLDKDLNSNSSFKAAQFSQPSKESDQSERISPEEKQNQEENLNSAKEIESKKERRESIKKAPMPEIPEDDAMSFGSKEKGQGTQETVSELVEDEGSQLSVREFTPHGDRIVDEEGESFIFPLQENSVSEQRPNDLSPAEPNPTPSEIRDGVGLGNNHTTPSAPTERFISNSRSNYKRITGALTSRETEPREEDSLLGEKSVNGVYVGNKFYPTPDKGNVFQHPDEQHQLKPANNVPTTAPTNDDKELTFRDFFVRNKEKIVSIIESEIAYLKQKTNPNEVQSPKEEDIDLLGKLKNDLEALHNGNFASISPEAKEILINSNEIEVTAEEVGLSSLQKKESPKDSLSPDEMNENPNKKKKRSFKNFFKLGKKNNEPKTSKKDTQKARKNQKSSKKDQSPSNEQQSLGNPNESVVYTRSEILGGQDYRDSKKQGPSAPPASHDRSPNFRRGTNDQSVIENGYRRLEPKPLPSSQQSLGDKGFDVRDDKNIETNYGSVLGLGADATPDQQVKGQESFINPSKAGEQTNYEQSILSGRLVKLPPPMQNSENEANNGKDIFVPPSEFESTLGSNIIDSNAETILYPGNDPKERSLERSVSDNTHSQPKEKNKGFFRKFLAPRNKGKKKDTNGKGAGEASKKQSKKNNKKRGVFSRKK